MLNSNIYNKAEAYKDKVLNKLQHSSVTPNKYGGMRSGMPFESQNEVLYTEGDSKS